MSFRIGASTKRHIAAASRTVSPSRATEGGNVAHRRRVHGEPIDKRPHEEVDEIQAVADLAEVTKGCVVEKPEHPTVVRLPQSQHHRQKPKCKQRLYVRRVHDVVDRRCLRWKQHEQCYHQREADRKHPLTSRGADLFGGVRRIRKDHGAYRARDQILTADQGNQPICRLGQERGAQEAKADRRAP